MWHKIATLTLFTFLALLFSNLDGCTGYKSTGNTAEHWMSQQKGFYSGDPNSIWPAIVSRFSLNHHEGNPLVQKEIHWYMQHPSVIRQTISQASPFLYYILQEVKKRQLPGELILLPIIESSYDPIAYSYSGAAGIWQLMPGTATGFGITQDWWYDGRRDVYDSTNAALDYLSYLHDFFNSNWLKAIAAYNSGPGTVQKAVQRNTKLHRKTDFFSLDLPAQTKAYVPKLLAIAIIISKPDKYPLHLPLVANKPAIASVAVDSQIDLAKAAKLASVDEQTIYQLNPGYVRWASDPDNNTRLFLPIDKINGFEKNLKKLPKSKRVTWHHYKVVSGDNLIGIAKKYDTTVVILGKVNNLKGHTIHIGQTLIVPESAHTLTRYPITDHNQKHYIGKTPAHTPGPKKLVYTVKKGDSLAYIAKRYHIKVSAIRFWNQLTHDEVAVNTQLILWLKQSSRKTAYASYIVRSGDNLTQIAKHHHMSVHQLQTTNHLSSSRIKVGQKLMIPLQ